MTRRKGVSKLTTSAASHATIIDRPEERYNHNGYDAWTNGPDMRNRLDQWRGSGTIPHYKLLATGEFAVGARRLYLGSGRYSLSDRKGG